MLIEIDCLRNTLPRVQQWARAFGSEKEPIPSNQCAMLVEMLSDLQTVCIAIRQDIQPGMQGSSFLSLALTWIEKQRQETLVRLASCSDERQFITENLNEIAIAIGHITRSVKPTTGTACADENDVHVPAMQKELEYIREKRACIEQWAHLFGAFLEPILPELCTTILETIRDLQTIFHAMQAPLEMRAFLVLPRLEAIGHSEKIVLQIASYRGVCRSSKSKYARQRQTIAVFLSQLAKTMEKILTVLVPTEQQPKRASVSTAEKRQRAGFSIVSSAEAV